MLAMTKCWQLECDIAGGLNVQYNSGTLGLRLPREDGICALPTIWFWPLSNCVNYQDEIRNSEFLKSGRLSWSEAGRELEDKGLPASSFWWNSRPSSSSLHKWVAQCSTSNGALLTFMHIWHYIKFRFQQKFWYCVKNEIPKKISAPQPQQSLKDARLHKKLRSIEVPRKKWTGPFSPFVEIWQLWKSVEVDWAGLEIKLASCPAPTHSLGQLLMLRLPQLVNCIWMEFGSQNRKWFILTIFYKSIID